MMPIIKIVLGIMTCVFFNVTQAAEWKESPAIAALFAKAKVQGTFVMFDVTENKLIGYNRTRAETRFIPASTFKIPNSLIGLSVGAVKSVNEVFPYDGKPRWMKEWEKDMDLREAIKLSALPVYQSLARRVGVKRMQAEVTKLGYGNAQIGKEVDQFWLNGSLKISAVEQAQFLARLAQGTLPLSKQVQENVRDIARLEKGAGWTLFGKTGWSTKEKGIGWWVGWVQKGNRFYSFAINIDMPVIADASKRTDLGRSALKELGVLN